MQKQIAKARAKHDMLTKELDRALYLQKQNLRPRNDKDVNRVRDSALTFMQNCVGCSKSSPSLSKGCQFWRRLKSLWLDHNNQRAKLITATKSLTVMQSQRDKLKTDIRRMKDIEIPEIAADERKKAKKLVKFIQDRKPECYDEFERRYPGNQLLGGPTGKTFRDAYFENKVKDLRDQRQQVEYDDALAPADKSAGADANENIQHFNIAQNDS